MPINDIIAASSREVLNELLQFLVGDFLKHCIKVFVNFVKFSSKKKELQFDLIRLQANVCITLNVYQVMSPRWRSGVEFRLRRITTAYRKWNFAAMEKPQP